MSTMKRYILNTGKLIVLCLAIGWLTVAYSQESRKQDDTVKEPAVPEILSVQPTGINGEPHLRPGK
jgi:predicted ABC-type exoprotein transport system permease subunit